MKQFLFSRSWKCAQRVERNEISHFAWSKAIYRKTTKAFSSFSTLSKIPSSACRFGVGTDHINKSILDHFHAKGFEIPFFYDVSITCHLQEVENFAVSLPLKNGKMGFTFNKPLLHRAQARPASPCAWPTPTWPDNETKAPDKFCAWARHGPARTMFRRLHENFSV